MSDGEFGAEPGSGSFYDVGIKHLDIKIVQVKTKRTEMVLKFFNAHLHGIPNLLRILWYTMVFLLS